MESKNSLITAAIIVLIASGLNIGYTEYRLRSVTKTTVENNYISMYIMDGNESVAIMSLDKYQVVHSKVIIDANLPDSIKRVEIRINNSFEANYLPYVWNNIKCPAGLYNISVHAWDENKTEYVDSSLVEIPKFEVYTPANFTAHEDVVIHANQTVIWRDGTFKVGIENYYDNGLAITNVKPFAINIFGTMILYNMTMRYMTSITLQDHGVLVCDNNTTFDWDNLLYRTFYENDYSIIYVEDYSTLYLRNSTKNIDNTNLPSAYYADDHAAVYKESGFLWDVRGNDDGDVLVYDDLSPYLGFAESNL